MPKRYYTDSQRNDGKYSKDTLCDSTHQCAFPHSLFATARERLGLPLMAPWHLPRRACRALRQHLFNSAEPESVISAWVMAA